MKNVIINEINHATALLNAVLADEELLENVSRIIEVCSRCLRNGNKILLAGNGGSAADAQHLAAEFVCRFKLERRGLPAIALTTNTSTLTAIANDYGYESVFSRQIEGLAVDGDVFIGISTSGHSANILRALEVCRDKGVVAVGFSGKSGNDMTGLCDHLLRVPSTETARIQEVHILIGHIICGLVEQQICDQ